MSQFDFKTLEEFENSEYYPYKINITVQTSAILIANTIVMVPHSDYASSPEPPCGLECTCVNIGVEVNENAQIVAVKKFIQNNYGDGRWYEDDSIHGNDNAIGWFRWLEHGYRITTIRDKKIITSTAANWKHDRNRGAQLVVYYTLP